MNACLKPILGVANLLYFMTHIVCAESTSCHSATVRIPNVADGEFAVGRVVTDPSTESLYQGSTSPLYVWNCDGELVILNDQIALINEFAIREFSQSKESLGGMAVKLLQMAVDSHWDCLLPGKDKTDDLKEIMRQRIPQEEFEAYEHLLNPVEYSTGENSWRITGTTISGGGAIVEYTLMGVIEPFALVEKRTVLKAPLGTVRDFGYLGDLDFEEPLRTRLMDQAVINRADQTKWRLRPKQAEKIRK